MNTSFVSKTRRSLKSAFLAVGVASLSCLSLNSASAAIIADFSGGNSTTEVDAYIGKAGDGWTNAWGHSQQSSTTNTSTVLSTNPFSGGGNYLQTTIVNNHASATRSGVVSRQYGATDEIKLNEAHTITFDYRLDMPTADFHRIYLFDSNQSTISPEMVGNTTWMIRGNPPNLPDRPEATWVLYNSTSTVSTGVKLTQGHIYRFTIDVSPSESTYRVKIFDLSDETNYYNPATPVALGFFSPQTSVGGYLNFHLGVTTPGNQGAFSLDNIAVVPEGSTVAMAGIGMAALAFLNRSRFKR